MAEIQAHTAAHCIAEVTECCGGFTKEDVTSDVEFSVQYVATVSNFGCLGAAQLGSFFIIYGVLPLSSHESACR